MDTIGMQMRFVARAALALVAIAVLSGCPSAVGGPTGGTVTVSLKGLGQQHGEEYYVAIRENRAGTTWLAGHFGSIPLSGDLIAMVLQSYLSGGGDWSGTGGTAYLISYYVDVNGSGDNGPDSGDLAGELAFTMEGALVVEFVYPGDFETVP